MKPTIALCALNLIGPLVASCHSVVSLGSSDTMLAAEGAQGTDSGPDASSPAPAAPAPDPTATPVDPSSDAGAQSASAAGLWLAFDSNRGGSRGIYFIRSDGTGLRRFTTGTAAETEPAFSPDGTKLAFTSFATGVAEIYARDLATGVVTQLTSFPNGAHVPEWSPDGLLIAFVAIPTALVDAGPSYYPPQGTADLYVIAPDGSGQRDIVGPSEDAGLSSSSNGAGSIVNIPVGWYPEYYPSKGTFSLDSTTIVFARTESINGIGIDGTGLRQIAGAVTEGTETPSVSPDGTRVAFASWNVTGENVLTTSYTGNSVAPAGDGLATIIASATSRTDGNRNPAWGPTGFIAFESVNFTSGTASIEIVLATGGTPFAVTTPGVSDDRNPAWAPAGFVPPN